MSTAYTPHSNDPLQYDLALPLEADFFPMGFPLHIATNFEHALAPASLMWSRFPKLFDRLPVRLKIVVSPAGLYPFPKESPVLRGQEHLFTIVAGRANFATADLNTGFGHLCLTREVASNAAYLRYHFLEPLVYVLIAAQHIAFVHASCVALDGRAILLCGNSGAGKTCLAYACARRGWDFISGDAVAIAGNDAAGPQRVIGRPFEIRFRHTAARLFPELDRFPQTLRPNGKTDIEADPADLGLCSAIESTASALVFLRRSDSSPVSIRPVSAEYARRELETGILFGDESIRTRQGQTLGRLARLPAALLHYSDLEEAEAALRLFAQGPR
jgi:hypothetical protein